MNVNSMSPVKKKNFILNPKQLWKPPFCLIWTLVFFAYNLDPI